MYIKDLHVYSLCIINFVDNVVYSICSKCAKYVYIFVFYANCYMSACFLKDWWYHCCTKYISTTCNVEISQKGVVCTLTFNSFFLSCHWGHLKTDYRDMGMSWFDAYSQVEACANVSTQANSMCHVTTNEWHFCFRLTVLWVHWICYSWALVITRQQVTLLSVINRCWVWRISWKSSYTY